MRIDRAFTRPEKFFKELSDNDKDPDLENNDISVYKVVSDDKNALIENEARGSQNTYSIISYMILFALLLIAVSI